MCTNSVLAKENTPYAHGYKTHFPEPMPPLGFGAQVLARLPARVKGGMAKNFKNFTQVQVESILSDAFGHDKPLSLHDFRSNRACKHVL